MPAVFDLGGEHCLVAILAKEVAPHAAVVTELRHHAPGHVAPVELPVDVNGENVPLAHAEVGVVDELERFEVGSATEGSSIECRIQQQRLSAIEAEVKFFARAFKQNGAAIDRRRPTPSPWS
ncbi:hypothetical protein ACIP1U_25145 [Cupriavidus sp. NPDC089707]|uniref:hypothetical protein n=1 Tax=Cupriavidus sp. NPDC089707 TaxID=3363963 RepID=UPI0037F56B3C